MPKELIQGTIEAGQLVKDKPNFIQQEFIILQRIGGFHKGSRRSRVKFILKREADAAIDRPAAVERRQDRHVLRSEPRAMEPRCNLLWCTSPDASKPVSARRLGHALLCRRIFIACARLFMEWRCGHEGLL